jgi:CubicO group peptidase (beta-lactamase class C family)
MDLVGAMTDALKAKTSASWLDVFNPSSILIATLILVHVIEVQMKTEIDYQQVDELIQARSLAEEFSGVVMICQKGRQVFGKSCGYANRSWQIDNLFDTRFRVASISKIFTAVSTLQLIDRGVLSLETGVVDLLELENTTIPEGVTVYHLLTMTSGIADWFDESGDWKAEWEALCRKYPIYLFRKNEDYLPLFVDEEPLAKVGKGHQYSGSSYILLGLVIERLTGLSYFDYVRENVFAPLSMTRSDFFALDGVDDEVAEGYIPESGEDGSISSWRKNIYSTTPEAAADGGATSTAADLCLFAQGLRTGALLSAGMTKQMLSPHVLQFPDKHRGYIWKYGYATMFLIDEQDRIVRYGLTGEEDGVSCRFYSYPGQDLDLVILGNISWSSGDLGWEIHDLLVSGTAG